MAACFAIAFLVAAILAMGGCDWAASQYGEDDDCHINASYEIECGRFDPGLGAR